MSGRSEPDSSPPPCASWTAPAPAGPVVSATDACGATANARSGSSADKAAINKIRGSIASYLVNENFKGVARAVHPREADCLQPGDLKAQQQADDQREEGESFDQRCGDDHVRADAAARFGLTGDAFHRVAG